MSRLKNVVAIFLILVTIITLNAFGQLQEEAENEVESGWSSVDDVFAKPENDKLVMKDSSELIKIGSTVKEVQEIMGVPDHIDKEKYIYYYRKSPVYFDKEWNVQSWDNRYGNLKVLKEIKKISLGSNISEVFSLKGFPLRIKKIEDSYKLEYLDDMIYINKRWQVEAIQSKDLTEYKEQKTYMTLKEILKEYELFLVDKFGVKG